MISFLQKATRKTDRVRPEEIDVTELTNEDLKDQLLKYGVNAGPIVGETGCTVRSLGSYPDSDWNRSSSRFHQCDDDDYVV